MTSGASSSSSSVGDASPTHDEQRGVAAKVRRRQALGGSRSERAAFAGLLDAEHARQQQQPQVQIEQQADTAQQYVLAAEQSPRTAVTATARDWHSWAQSAVLSASPDRESALGSGSSGTSSTRPSLSPTRHLAQLSLDRDALRSPGGDGSSAGPSLRDSPLTAPADGSMLKQRMASKRPKGLNLGLLNSTAGSGPRTAIPVQSDADDTDGASTSASASGSGSGSGSGSSGSSASTQATSSTGPLHAFAPMQPPMTAGGPPRRPLLARLDTSERVKTLSAAPAPPPPVPRISGAAAAGSAASGSSPRLRLETRLTADGSRSPVPLRSATADAALRRNIWDSGHDAGAAEIARGLSPGPPSAMPDGLFPPIDSEREPFRRGSEPPPADVHSRHSSPLTADDVPLPPEPATPATARSLSLSAGTAISSDFHISEILPGFLYLGPDIGTPSEAEHLSRLGVRRVLNCAAEIEEGGGKHLNLHRGAFGIAKYRKLPIWDHVEARGVQRYVEEACAFLDDARLHSSPTYVHCKAGKSRSVLIVMAYLIHHLHWPLRRSYAHVVERRRDVSPNIGFVAELMRFEEKCLGHGKARGNMRASIAPDESDPASAATGADEDDMRTAVPAAGQGRRGSHVPDATPRAPGGGVSRRERDPHARDSMPAFPQTMSHGQLPRSSLASSSVDASSAAGPGAAAATAQEEDDAAADEGPVFAPELRGDDGRYRAQRPPARADSLAPNRRATLAALGSEHAAAFPRASTADEA
jgi:hypothetical protein